MARPIRIGVWCDYGVTLTPTEGIGVFVANLVRGLLELDEPVEVVMLVRPGDQKVVANLRRHAPSRLRILPDIWPTFPRSPRLTRLLQVGIRRIAWTRQKFFRLDRRSQWLRNKVQGGEFSAPFAFLLRWALAIFPMLASLRRWAFFLVVLPFSRSAWFRRLRQRLSLIFDPMVMLESAGCDVWLVPLFRFHYPLTFPSVLVIHDLVHVYYPDAIPPWDREELGELVPARAAEATICACMSDFIREQDLLKTLHLDSKKVRLIQPAPPVDTLEISGDRAARAKPAKLVRPYLFYPAAFRSYKNHAVLIKALRLLRDKHDENELDLVFTGIHSVPRELRRTIRDCELQGRVHVLGCVDRATLDALYRNAVGTILPSFYEEVCFPVYEALQRGCPVAFSRIPALVEQYQAMGDALLCFDPEDPEDLARIILKIRDDRESIRATQQAAAPALWKRTWQDAAREWLKVFHEAMTLAAAKKQNKVFPFDYRQSA